MEKIKEIFESHPISFNEAQQKIIDALIKSNRTYREDTDLMCENGDELNAYLNAFLIKLDREMKKNK